MGFQTGKIFLCTSTVLFLPLVDVVMLCLWVVLSASHEAFYQTTLCRIPASLTAHDSHCISGIAHEYKSCTLRVLHVDISSTMSIRDDKLLHCLVCSLWKVLSSSAGVVTMQGWWLLTDP